MKLHLPKALLSAVLAAGLLGGAQAADFEGSFSWGSNTNLSFTFDDTDNAPVTITGSNQEDPTALTSDQRYKSTNVHTETYTPNINIGNNSANSWTLSFNIEIKDSYKKDTDLVDFRITGLVLEAFLFNSSGSLQSDELARPVYFTLASGDASKKITADLAGNKADADYTLDLPVALSQSSESSTSYTLKCQSAQTATSHGTFVGLEGMKVTVASVIKDTANVTWANLSSATSWSGTSWKTQAGSLGELAENWNAAATFTAAGANDTHTVNIDTAAKASKISVTQGSYIFEDKGGTLTVSDGISITEGATATIKTDTTLAGEVANAGNLSFLGKLTVDAETEATLGGTGTTTISSTIENEGKLSLTGNVIMGGIAADFDIKTEGSATYVIDANNSDATNTEGNGFVCTSGREYWLAMGGTNEVSTGITIADAENNTFALHASTATGDTGIYFSTVNNYVDTSKFYVKSGDVSVIGTGAENATGADKYLINGGTMQLTDGTVKNSEIEYTSGGINLARTTSVLELDDASTASSMLLLATGTTGTIDLKTTATVSGGNDLPDNTPLNTPITEGIESTKFQGTLKISGGGVLQLGSDNFIDGSTYQWKPDVSSLAYIELAGGELKYRGGTANLGDIKVTAASTLQVYDVNKYDVGAEDNTVVGIDTLDLGANLALSTHWKSNVNISLLTGTNTNAVMTVGDCSDDKRMLTAVVDNAFAGKIKVTGGDSTLSNLSFRDAAGTGNIIQLTGLKATGNGNDNNSLTVSYNGTNSLVKIDRSRSADGQATDISDVKLANGSTLEFYGTTNQIVTTLSKLDVTGTGTVKATNHEGNIVINGLTGTNATLNLETSTPTSRNSLFTFNDSSTNNFSGTINVLTSTTSGSRRTVFNLNTAEGAKNAVVSLADGQTGNNKSDTVALAIGANKVTIAGLKDGATHKDGTLMVVSGTQDIGDVNFASDSTKRTLAINAAENQTYSSSADIKSSINLEKDGKGSQTFSGDMSEFDGSVAVNLGTLSFTGTDSLTVTDLTVKAGGTLSVGANGTGLVTVGSAATTYNTESTTGSTPSGVVTLEGGASITGGLDLSSATTLQLDKMTGTDLVTVGGNLTLPEGTLTLHGDILQALASLDAGSQLDIFSVDSFTLGETAITSNLTYSDGYTLDKVFNGGSAEYYLGYTMAEGANTVYIGKVIPEPTTATLSLLALAALAARRRRK